MSSTEIAPASAPETEPAAAQALHCANCQARLHGPFCHGCGQSVKSVLRPIHSMVEDTLDMVFHVDERIVHTLPPLFLKPGFLTLEYFAGRRVRYVQPFRLMFVFCLLSFFAVHLAIGFGRQGNTGPMAQGTHVTTKWTGEGETGEFARDTSEGAVQKRLDAAQADIEAARQKPGADAAALSEQSALRVHEANRRMAELNAFEHNHPDERIDPTHPEVVSRFHIGWLPDLVNIRLDQGLARVKANLAAMSQGDAEVKERFVTGLFGVLPQTMLILLPVFALLLKIVYLFRRRLYMEHMIVSLHSHAFLFLSVLLVALLSLLGSLLRPHAHWAYTGTGWLQGAIFSWMPIYLLLTQKRVYRQGWGITLLKYFFVGFWYAWMLFWALLVAAAISLSH
jgi:uncharacterized protein DUF3667